LNVNLRTKNPDPILKQILAVLQPYAAAHPTAQVDVYRWSPYSVRIRVIDPAFKGLSRPDRHDRLWKLFETLPDAAVADISMLLPLTPAEAKRSYANMDFENPEPNPLLPITTRKAAGSNGTKPMPFAEVLRAVDQLTRDEQDALAAHLYSQLARKRRQRRVAEEAKP